MAVDGVSGPVHPEADVLDTAAAGGLVVRGGTLRVLGYVTGIGVSVLGAALMLRHLGVVDFGRYTTVFSLVAVVAALTDLGLTGVALRRSAVADAAGREQIVRNLLGMRLLGTTVGIAVVCAFGAAAGYPAVMVEGIGVAGVGLMVLVAVDSYSIPLQLGLQLGWTTALELVRQVGQTAAVVALVLIGASLLPFTGAQIPGAIAALALAAWLVRGRTRLTPTFELDQWRAMLHELLPYAAASAIGAVYFRIEIIVLSLVSSGVQTGLFSAAFRITEVVVGIPWLVASSALPVIARAAENDRERLAYALRQMFHASLVAGVGIAIAILLGARFGLDVVAGSKYRHSVDVLRIQSATVAFTFLVTQWGFALLSLKRTRALLAANAGALVLIVALTLVLASTHGATGASVALVCGEALLAVAYAFSLSRVDPDLRPRLGPAPRVALAAGAGVGVGVLSSTPSLPSALIGLTVYVAALAVMRALPSELGELLPGRRARSA